ncbi:MAG: hypothetical protein ABJC13_09120 [Acidobacteriota bacterium]
MYARVRPRKGEPILRLGQGEEAFGYTLAGRRFWTDRPLFCLGPPEARGRLPRNGRSLIAPPLEVADLDPDHFEELALGPPILLLLAARAIWALHASAVFVHGRLFVFLGESGRGKSTLAALEYPEWERAADDLLPFELAEDRLIAHLDYPQLKLDPARRYRAPAPVAALIALAGPGTAPAPRLTRLRPAETARLLLGQTVAARRYGPDLLAAHLEACVAAASVVPAYALELPRDLGRLEEAGQILSNLARS